MYKAYLFEQEKLITDDMIDSLFQILPEKRKKQALSYHKRVDRNNCIITFVLLKIALRRCFGIIDFTIQYEKRGKPYLKEHPDVFFNISHCADGCIVVVADEQIGVDMQNFIPFSWEVAERVCCSEEIEVLRCTQNREFEFIRMWTMKESYLKMTGVGIGENLKQVNTLVIKDIEIIQRGNSMIAICRNSE